MKSRFSFFIALAFFCGSLPVFAMVQGQGSGPPGWMPPNEAVDDPVTPGFSYVPQLSRPVYDVLKLVRSNVSNDTIYSYIQNSPDLFDLSSDDVIYLDHQNVDPKIISAMMRHDRELRAQQNAALDQTTLPPVLPPETSAPDWTMEPNTTNWTATTNPAAPPDESYYYPPSYYPPSEMAPGGYDDTGQSAGYFYPSLAPYGSWSQLPGYGPCWQPFCAKSDRNWKPFCNRGQWFFTDNGWFWNSFYPWGWAPFHFGRWFNHPRLGWIWFPGKKWSPAWVTWRDSSKDIGWAPMPPGSDFDQNGLTYHGREVPNDFGFGLRPNDFTFVPARDFGSMEVGSHRLDLPQSMRIFPNTRVVNNLAWSNGRILNAGLDVNLIAADSRQPIIRARLKDSGSLASSGFFPGQGGNPATVSVFRPQLLNHPQPNSRESLSAILPPGSGFRPGLLNNPQPNSQQSLSIPPTTYPAIPQQTGPQQNGQPFRFGREFPKVIVNNGPPFAPAGTRVQRFVPTPHLQGMGTAHISSGFSSGSGHHN
ncbi:MAG TPA: DUF6600 domain-containing protein [Verrucomicrobiae bacterium]|nr:DUF6600 domain-containing protein [Verrucomicrobiae bacterium]